MIRIPVPAAIGGGNLGQSIRVRLTLWYVALLATVLLAFALAVYFFLITSIASDVSRIEQSYRKMATAEAEQNPARYLKRVPHDSPVLGQVTFTYQPKFDPNGQEVSFGPNPEDTNRQVLGELFNQTKQGCHQTRNNRLACTWPVYSSKSHSLVGAVALEASLNGVDHAQWRLRTALIFGIPISLLIALLGGWVLASRALSPVEELRQTAQSITATDLSRRIGLNRSDELGRLANTLDDMIARLDLAFREQRQLTADVSHELRTPLSVIQAQASLALKRQRTPQEYATVLTSIQEETERMSKIVSDLLWLARADSGQEAVEREPLRLDLVASWAKDQIESMAAEKGIEVGLRVVPLMIEGDVHRLQQMVLNLVDNAVKYTNPGGSVRLSVGREGRSALLEVADTGEGIHEKSLPHIFQRFYRTDRSRSRGDGGCGLGLAIAQWIAEAHEGSIGVQSTVGEGTTFTVRIPLSPIEPKHKPARRGLQPRRRRYAKTATAARTAVTR